MALDVLDEVHLFTEMERKGKTITVKIACDPTSITVAAPSGPLRDAGISAWPSDLTCEQCLVRTYKPLIKQLETS